MTQSSHNEATERLGTPEHLDHALYVTTAKAWLALCVLVVMTAAVIAWAVFGEVATYVEAKGIFLSRDAGHSRSCGLQSAARRAGRAVAQGKFGPLNSDSVLHPNLNPNRGGRCAVPTVLQMEGTECAAA